MLFIIDHTHAAEDCPAGTMRPYKEFTADLNKAATASDVKIIEGYMDGPSHHIYFVVEANDPSQIYSFTLPLLSLGITRVAPVMKWNKAISLTKKLGRQK